MGSSLFVRQGYFCNLFLTCLDPALLPVTPPHLPVVSQLPALLSLHSNVILPGESSQQRGCYVGTLKSSSNNCKVQSLCSIQLTSTPENASLGSSQDKLLCEFSLVC